MSVGDAGSHVILFIAVVSIASVATAAFYPAVRDLVASRTEEDQAILERVETRLTVTAVAYDPAAQELTVTARNDGDEVVEVDALSAVVDGVPRSLASAEVEGVASELWGTDEVATLRVQGLAAAPSRVLVVGASGGGGDLVLLGDTAPAAAGVGMYVGAGGNNTRYFHAMSVGAYGTSASGVFKTKNAADTTVADVLRVYNSGEDPATVTLTGSQVANASVEAFTWTVKNGGTAIASLDHRGASPDATFDVPAGSTYTMTVRLDLAEGSGQHNAQFDFSLTLGVG